MSVLTTALTGWLVINEAVFAALLSKRPRPELRSRLFLWILGAIERIVRAFSCNHSAC
jgi:hypothetical protein